jgi:hypothetical protein
MKSASKVLALVAVLFALAGVRASATTVDDIDCPNGTPVWGIADGGSVLPVVCMNTARANTPSPGATVNVTSAAQLTTLLATGNALCGETLKLTAGASFSGNFTVTSVCNNANWLTIETSGLASFPAEGTQITPCSFNVSSLPGRTFPCSSPVAAGAQLVSTGTNSPFSLAANAACIRFVGLELTRTASTGLVTDIVAMANVGGVNHIIFDQVWMHGTTNDETSRGWSSSDASFVASVDGYYSDFHCLAVYGSCTDAKAISGGVNNNDSTQEQAIKITNNYLEASGENILFGGGQSNTTPADIEIRRNTLAKPLIWDPIDPSYIGVPIPADGKSTNLETFNITASNNKMLLAINGGGNQSITLTQGASQTAANVCTDILAVLNATVKCSTGGGHVDILTLLNGPSASIQFVTTANSAYSTLGYTVGTISGSNLGQWIVKNLFELKNAQRVLFEGNTLQNVWAGFSQDGFAIVVTPKNQSGTLCPICLTNNIVIRYNTANHMNAAMQIATVKDGSPGALPAAGNGYSFHDNQFDGIRWSGCSSCATSSSTVPIWEDDTVNGTQALQNAWLNHNTFVTVSGAQNAALLGLSGAQGAPGQMSHISFTNNIGLAGQQGTINSKGGTDSLNCAFGETAGLNMITDCWSPFTFGGNAILNFSNSTPQTVTWPGVNCTSETQVTVYKNYNNGDGGDYHINPASPCHNTALDGKDPGADQTQLANVLAGNVVGTDITASNSSACANNGVPTPGCSKRFAGLSTNAGNTNAQTQIPDPAPTNVSTKSISSLMYSGFNGDVWCEYQPWKWGSSGHPDIGMDESWPAQVLAQLSWMKTIGCTVVWVDWYNSTIDGGFDELVTQLIAAQLATGVPSGLKLNILYDQLNFGSVCPQGASDQTNCISNQINADMDTQNSEYFGQSFYTLFGGKPISTIFASESLWSGTNWTTVWANVRTHTNGYAAGGIKMVFRYGSFSHTQSDGEYAWIQPTPYVNTTPNTQRCWNEIDGDTTCNFTTGLKTGGTDYLGGFYTACLANPSKICIGMIAPGFDWSNSGYTGGVQKLAQRGCAQVPALMAAKCSAAGFSSGTQLYAVGVVTFNDQGEGTGIEQGINNCYAVSASATGSTLNVSLVSSDGTYATTSTFDHLDVYSVNSFGQFQLLQGGLSTATTTVNLSGLLPMGTTNVYTQFVGTSMVQNATSAAVPMTVSPTLVPAPAASLFAKVSQ